MLDQTKLWKKIKDFDDYIISNYGDIYSIKSAKMLKPTLFNNYYTIKLSKKIYLIHRLVYNTFKTLTNNNLVIDHIDRNPLNNHIDNLRK